jgi:hypothetical protein
MLDISKAVRCEGFYEIPVNYRGRDHTVRIYADGTVTPFRMTTPEFNDQLIEWSLDNGGVVSGLVTTLRN